MHRKTVWFSKSAISRIFAVMLVSVIAAAGFATGYYIVTQSPPPEPPFDTSTPTIEPTSEPTVTQKPTPTSTSGSAVTVAPSPTSTSAPTSEPSVTEAPTSTAGPTVTPSPTPTSPPGVTQPPITPTVTPPPTPTPTITPSPTPTTPPKFLLSVSFSPSAGGTVSKSPSAGSTGYVSGTVVTLTANPNQGYKFSYFNVDGAISTNNHFDLKMDKQHNVVAYFVKIPVPVCSDTKGVDVMIGYNYYYDVSTTVTNTGGPGEVTVFAQMDKGSEPTLSQTYNLKASESRPFVFRFSFTGAGAAMSGNFTSVPHFPYCWAIAK